MNISKLVGTKRPSALVFLMAGLLGACLGLALAQSGGCAEKDLGKKIDTAMAERDAATKNAADKVDEQAALRARLDEAEKTATASDGTVDYSKEYAVLMAGATTPEQKVAIASAVAAKKSPAQAATELIAAAAADAKKYADQAAAAAAAVTQMQQQVQAAHDKDTASWGAGAQSIGSLANLLWPGVGPLVGAVLLKGVQVARGVTFKDGQTDGATQVTQATAALREFSPSLNAAFDAIGPLVKTIVANTLDEHVADVVAEHKDSPPPDLNKLIPAGLSPVMPAVATQMPGPGAQMPGVLVATMATP